MSLTEQLAKSSVSPSYSLCLRSTQTKATSFTVKQHGSTSASPWWTSSRNASGYQNECLRKPWRRRAKTRVSSASWGSRAPTPSCPFVRLPNLHPVPVPKHNTGIQSSTICNSHLFLLNLICIWTPRVRMLNLRLPFQQTTDLLPHPSSHLLPWVQIQMALQRANKDWWPDMMFWNILIDLTGSSLLHSRMDQLPQSSGDKASALTQTFKLWGDLIAHNSWACILMKIRRLVKNTGRQCSQWVCGYRKCYYF